MSNFNNFDKLNKFDKGTGSFGRTVCTVVAFQMILTVVVLGFLGWVIVSLLSHFGVI
jgi:hypothetical protein